MVSGLLDLYVLFSLELNPINGISKKEESHVLWSQKPGSVGIFKIQTPWNDGKTEPSFLLLEQETAGTKWITVNKSQK